MSTFACPFVEVRALEPIPGADRIELAVVGDYRSVVKKGVFSPGDVVVYAPEGAVLPEALLRAQGFWDGEKGKGTLAGPRGDRLKAQRLRGCLSQGLLLAPSHPLEAWPAGAVGDDAAPALGIVKYEPPIPASMSGEVANLFGVPLKYDIENAKAFPDVLRDGEPVEMAEKAHGTFCGVAVVPGLSHPDVFGGDGVVYSKGLGAKGLVFKDNDANNGNVYVQAARGLGLHDRIREAFPGEAVHVLGEVHGAGVQDLHYGRKDRGFAAFDIWLDGRFLDRADFREAARRLGVPTLPVLHEGPYSKEAMLAHTDGPTVLGGGGHIREGVVVRPMAERRDEALGRVILKSVSAAYLLRKGAGEEVS